VSGPPGTWDAVQLGLQKAFDAAPADLTPEALATRLRAAVPCYAQLVGTTFLELATQLTSQLHPDFYEDRIGELTVMEWQQQTAGWGQVVWDQLPTLSLPVHHHLALDEVLLDETTRGERPPSLRFWLWQEPAIVLGRSQKGTQELNLAAVQTEGWTIARRISGGGAMLVGPDQAITYSLIIPESLFPAGGLRRSYELCDAFALLALRQMGVPAHYVPSNDIGTPRGKLSGAAQARRRGVVLHHTTMTFRITPELVQRLFRFDSVVDTRTGVRSAPKVVDPLSGIVTESYSEVCERLQVAFAASFPIQLVDISPRTWDAVRALVASKYQTPEWVMPCMLSP
jgi:lipoate-protein ligase A